MAENKVLAEMKQLIYNCVRDAVADVMSRITVTAIGVTKETAPESNREISDDDFDIADDFMNSL